MTKLLILASNPRRDLNLDREVSDLNNAVKRLADLEVVLGLGVRSQELQELLAEHSPQFVHFCGHGAGEKGLVFQDEDGREQLISTEILARIFKTFAEEIHCTVLNACDSDRQAEAIGQQIQYVVGMSQPILDQAAHLFAVGFYKGLAAQKTIEQAYEMGCNAIQIWSETQSQTTQSRQYRKLATVGEDEDVQAASPLLPEYQKPVLLREGIRWTSDVEKHITPEHSERFVEFIQQEADRKEYKDRTREAYDNFGQYSAQNAASSLTKSDYERRRIFLDKVKQFWIEGFLKPSLQGFTALRLDLKARPDAIADLTQGIEALSLELDASYEKLHPTRIYGEMGQGRTLLILGEPGAGKTIALLQLAQRLIDRSEQNLSLPMPVVLNLSSWAREQKSIVDWAIDELREKYQVPKSLSKPWIGQQQLILLLDGLDEVNQDDRNDCVRTLNEFIGLFPQTEVAVCSRVRDYEALTERLQISSAFCLQPLTSEQVYQFLDDFGGSLGGLKTILKSDADLERFAQTPLILNFMSSAYQGWSVEKLMNELRSTSDRNQHLFNTYIDRRLERGETSEYTKDEALRWLGWIASRMVRAKQSIFLIEEIQPTWLKDKIEERAYQIRTIIFAGLVLGLSSGMISGLIFGSIGLMFGFTQSDADFIDVLKPGLMFGLSYGLAAGLSIGLICGVTLGLPRAILPLERLSWSWQRAKSKFVRELFAGIGYGLILGLLMGLSLILIAGLIISLMFGGSVLIGRPIDFLNVVLMLVLIFGPVFGLVFALGSGLSSSETVQRIIPNQGIRTSLRNCLIIGLSSGTILSLVFGLIVGLISWLSSAPSLRLWGLLSGIGIGLALGLIFGLFFGLKYGGAACIQHLTLRQILYRKGRIPWNYAKFLNFASDRLLMKRVGGGYVFFHRMLLEHFAQMHPK
jgi:hypothetical protein